MTAPAERRRSRWYVWPVGKQDLEAEAPEILLRHWGGYAWALTQLLTSALALVPVTSFPPGQTLGFWTGPVEAGLLAVSAVATVWLTYRLQRAQSSLAGVVLLGLVACSLALVLASGSPAAAPYAFLRLCFLMNIWNGFRAARLLARNRIVPAPSGMTAFPKAIIAGSALWIVATLSVVFIFAPELRFLDGDLGRFIALLFAPPLLAWSGYAAWAWTNGSPVISKRRIGHLGAGVVTILAALAIPTAYVLATLQSQQSAAESASEGAAQEVVDDPEWWVSSGTPGLPYVAGLASLPGQQLSGIFRVRSDQDFALSVSGESLDHLARRRPQLTIQVGDEVFRSSSAEMVSGRMARLAGEISIDFADRCEVVRALGTGDGFSIWFSDSHGVWRQVQFSGRGSDIAFEQLRARDFWASCPAQSS